MASKRAIIGTIIGAVILAIGAASLVSNLGLREFAIDDTYAAGAPIPPYSLSAPGGTVQRLEVAASSFEARLTTPEGGTRASSHEGPEAIEWEHGPSGESVLVIESASEVSVRGTLYSQADPIFLAYDGFVMISGLVIMGFSAGFGRRRPRGF
ncbi:MAG: hypothetical protein OXU86_07945 [Thaumarchaeota archaeon]|nr:hypothetical protein [Nitrososphaerota archaeon]RNJ72752.1 MAG: hypothetical protein EB833_04310 [Thaumarchaeota archaeon S13]RNJ72802.1 MAG: hypothetical protein EB832_03040 [Thaumarchaeota archaeon S14]RNJ76101.1 MAG: hypothetical protein EB824_00955 [Thaumarchaeota archaeon S15]MDD9814136.1 hypothetical protein [Nitrososphaerota archaeon]